MRFFLKVIVGIGRGKGFEVIGLVKFSFLYVRKDGVIVKTVNICLEVGFGSSLCRW